MADENTADITWAEWHAMTRGWAQARLAKLQSDHAALLAQELLNPQHLARYAARENLIEERQSELNYDIRVAQIGLDDPSRIVVLEISSRKRNQEIICIRTENGLEMLNLEPSP